jgi:hypothetical protein
VKRSRGLQISDYRACEALCRIFYFSKIHIREAEGGSRREPVNRLAIAGAIPLQTYPVALVAGANKSQGGQG